MSFEKFWAAYPKKCSKGFAMKAWAKLNPNLGLIELMLNALEKQKQWRTNVERANALLPRWKRTFVPHWKFPATWINQQCWLDEIPAMVEQQKKSNTKYCASCQNEEGKYPIAGKLYCLRCYDRTAHPENYVPKLRVVK